MDIHNDDAAWDRPPTAFEIAHYDALLNKQANAASERARAIFGTCLLQLTQLGMKQGQARSMLGKWRSKAKDDDLLIRVVKAAHAAGTPDPVSYITKAIAGSQERTEKVTALQKAEWTLLGWESPKVVAGRQRFKGAVRGQVWRDPFGKLSILPPPDNVSPPTLDEDPGITLDKAA